MRSERFITGVTMTEAALTVDEIRELRKKQRKLERRTAKKLGVDLADFRAKGGLGDEQLAEQLASLKTRVKAVPVKRIMPWEPYRDQIIELLNLNKAEAQNGHCWVGFSMDQLYEEQPDPEKAFALLLQRVTQYNVQLRMYYLSQDEKMLLLGPIPRAGA
jgi:hypothetical protein